MRIVDEAYVKEAIVQCPECKTHLAFTSTDTIPNPEGSWLEFYDNHIICACCGHQIPIKAEILFYLKLYNHAYYVPRVSERHF